MKRTLFKYSVALFLGFILHSPLFAQYQLNGDASSLGDDCFELTPAKDGKSGSVWFTPKINLKHSFDFTLDINFGCSDGGADGMAFCLNPDSTALGGGGHGQGFLYLWNSLCIEFDNFDNGSQFDPNYDHMAIFKRGKTSHIEDANLAGPIQTDPESGNVEDCDYHEIRVTWDAYTRTIKAFFDCELRLSYTGNIVSELFDGDPMVYWGFTAATGAKNNKQIACLKEIKFFEPQSDYIMCPGGNVQLNADEDGTNYNWEPTESLNDPTISNPLASPEVNTTYYVTITDDCAEFIDTINIEVQGLPIDLELSDTTLCIGEELTLDVTTDNASYEWSTGENTASISPIISNYYVVTVTLDNSCISNYAADVNFISLPPDISTTYNTICPGETILLDVSFPDASYLWQDGTTGATYLVKDAGLYSVIINHFCENKTLSIDIGYESSCTDVYIPNAFSPNNDRINDQLVILAGTDIIEIEEFLIADRWGEIIFQQKNFQANDETYGWDGTFKGKQVPNGVYIYFAEIIFRNGEKKIVSGDITILR